MVLSGGQEFDTLDTEMACRFEEILVKCSKVIIVAMVFCGLVMGCSSKNNKTGSDQERQKMIVVDNVIISQDHLSFDYEVRNAFEHDIWVCDDMYVFSSEKVEPTIEKGVVLIRLRFNFPYTFFYDEMVARYVRLSPGKIYNRSISVRLPLRDCSLADNPMKNKVQDTVELNRAIFEVGYFSEDLKEKLFNYIKKAKRKVITSDYARDMADTLEDLNEKNDVNNIIFLPYLWEGIKQEQTLSVASELHLQR
ncbi:MAG: hypothetical protein ACYS18_09070 [Planctomycetota bacterium]|jgi:hypothetical protein